MPKPNGLVKKKKDGILNQCEGHGKNRKVPTTPNKPTYGKGSSTTTTIPNPPNPENLCQPTYIETGKRKNKKFVFDPANYADKTSGGEPERNKVQTKKCGGKISKYKIGGKVNENTQWLIDNQK